MMYNEPEFIKLIFLLADTQSWLNDLCKEAFLQLPLGDKKKLATKTYYLTPAAMAHILEKHYHKINRFPQASKFTIPLADIIALIRDASTVTPQQIPGSTNWQRTITTNDYVGFNNTAQLAKSFTVITDAGGRIITAFPV